MKRFGMIATFATLMMVSLSCDKIDGGDSSADNQYRPLNLTTKSAEFAHLGNSFAFEYIDRINTAEKKDYIISPLSMQFLLGMILDGTKGQTADEICNVLGYGAGEVDAVNEYCRSMLEQLPELDRQTKLSIANAIFVNQNFPLLDSYKKTVGKNFKAEVSNLDFTNANSSLKTINKWCDKQTNGMIPKVLDKVTSDAIAYLLNALYFKSQWSEKFSKSNTSEEDFWTGGRPLRVPMMKAQRYYPYGECEAFQALKIPYGNGAFNMLVLLPSGGKTISDVIAAMKTMDWSGFVNSMYAWREVDLWLPRFETKYEIELNDILAAMGMPAVFNPGLADFSAMCEYSVYLSLIKQDAAIKVEEEGTEAAAVSIAEIRYGSTGVNNGPIVFHADRPFLYLITETSTNAILFAGRYSAE